MRNLEGESPEVCERCGGDAFRPASRREQLARWFTHGAGAGTSWYCRNCSASWSGASSYRALHQAGSGWHRRARLPLDVLAAVRDARRWHPMPLFYAAVGAIAVAPAVAVALLTPAPWWMALVGVPVSAMVGAFLWSLATAVGRGGRRDVLWRVAPERAWQRELEEELTGIREQISGFALLVPEGWPEQLTIGGLGWSIPPRAPRELREVTVVADQGDPLLDPDLHTPGWRPPAPRVEIRFSRESWTDPEGYALTEFVERAFPASPLDLDGDEPTDSREMERRMRARHLDHERLRERWEARLSDRWRDGNLRVDGAAVTARLLTHDDTDVGVATFTLDGQGVLLIAEGHDLDTLMLVGVADPTPLVEEFERRRRRIFTQSAG